MLDLGFKILPGNGINSHAEYLNRAILMGFGHDCYATSTIRESWREPKSKRSPSLLAKKESNWAGNGVWKVWLLTLTILSRMGCAVKYFKMVTISISNVSSNVNLLVCRPCNVVK